MIDINNNSQWKNYREEMEKGFKSIGEYPRITRCNKNDEGKFEAVVLEGGLNIKYNIKTREIIIWGVGKRYSNGYITYEDLKKKVEMFEGYMRTVK